MCTIQRAYNKALTAILAICFIVFGSSCTSTSPEVQEDEDNQVKKMSYHLHLEEPEERYVLCEGYQSLYIMLDLGLSSIIKGVVSDLDSPALTDAKYLVEEAEDIPRYSSEEYMQETLDFTPKFIIREGKYQAYVDADFYMLEANTKGGLVSFYSDYLNLGKLFSKSDIAYTRAKCYEDVLTKTAKSDKSVCFISEGMSLESSFLLNNKFASCDILPSMQDIVDTTYDVILVGALTFDDAKEQMTSIYSSREVYNVPAVKNSDVYFISLTDVCGSAGSAFTLQELNSIMQ